MAQDANKMEKTGWARIGVSNRVCLEVIYHDFRIKVYAKDSVTAQPEIAGPPRPITHLEQFEPKFQFYYQPALILDQGSARYVLNNDTGNYDVLFSVVMWNDELETTIKNGLFTHYKRQIPMDEIIVRLLPIEEIRIEAHVDPTQYRAVGTWTSYASQGRTFIFKLICLKEDTAQKVCQQIAADPVSFAMNFVVYYSLDTQNSKAHKFAIQAETLKSTRMCAELLQRFPNKDAVFLKADDAKHLLMETASNVVAAETFDEGFDVSPDQELSLANQLEKMLGMQKLSS
ncbi:hypothetical protein BV898_01014 [Hypsibius exemplaris]|uniref:Uncharacterized protein n=1 Tax=Hypsibius exemplaris TaxID=2072580 RepID=A0A1W0XCX1_HYPEX|nr:hypothetical protein BV898_01014 [Hypsibius exemplaris]